MAYIPDYIDPATGDAGGKNTDIQTESDIILDFTEKDPFSENGIY